MVHIKPDDLIKGRQGLGIRFSFFREKRFFLSLSSESILTITKKR